MEEYKIDMLMQYVKETLPIVLRHKELLELVKETLEENTDLKEENALLFKMAIERGMQRPASVINLN